MVKGIVLLSLFALTPASKASSFWDLSGRKSISQRLRNQGERARVDRGSPIHLHSPGAGLTSLLKEERPYQLFLVQSSRAQGVCSERPDSPRIPSGSPGRATRCARQRAAYAWDPEALQGVRKSGTGFAGGEPWERCGEWRGRAHPGLTGSRARERAPDGAGAPEDAGMARLEWQQLTSEGLWPCCPDPG